MITIHAPFTTEVECKMASYDRLLKSWPELQIRITQLAREGSPPPGPRLLQAEVVKQFQSDSLRTDSRVRVLPPQPGSLVSATQNVRLRFCACDARSRHWFQSQGSSSVEQPHGLIPPQTIRIAPIISVAE